MDNESVSSDEESNVSSRKSISSIKDSISIKSSIFAGFGYLANNAKLSLVYENNAIRPREEANVGRLKNVVKIKFEDSHGLYKLTNPHLFESFPGLQHVVFNHTNTDTLHKDLFHGLVNLETIDFAHNELKHIHAGLFNSSLKSLTKINLSYNGIVHLHNEVFHELVNLVELDLNSNSIRQIEANAFDGLTNLSSLNLSYNDLTHLDDGIFKNTKNLTSIKVSYNELKELHPIIFRGLSKLRLIDFEGNFITSLSVGVFSHLKQLNNVNFSHNQITQIDLHKLINLVNEKEQHLEQYDFRCDYENIEKFKFASYASLFFEFYMVHECDEFKEISAKELLFERHINMWYLSKHVLTKASLQAVNEHIMENLDAEKYSPLDFFLAINTIPNKVISQLVHHVESILKGVYNKEIKNENFKVKCVESVEHLCTRNNEELMRDVIKYFDIVTFSECFETVLACKNETMAIILLNHFWDLVVRKFKSEHEYMVQDILAEHNIMLSSDLKRRCFSLNWWHFYWNLIEIYKNADESVRKLFLMIFEYNLEKKSPKNALNEESVELNARKNESELKIHKDASHTHLLHFIAASNQSNLIQHSTTKTFLQRKWSRLPRFVYYFNLLLYVFFVVIYTIHLETIKVSSPLTYSAFRFSSLALAILFLVEEIVQIVIFASNLKHHFLQNVRNIFECVNYPLCVFTLSAEFLDEDIKYSLDALTIVLTYAILILRVEKFEFIGLYVTVLKKILGRSVKVLPLIILTSLSFFFAFRVISKRNVGDNSEVLFNSSFSYTLIKLFTMNLGDFETDKMGLGKESMFADLITHLLYAVYLFFLPILILNIFVGISVDEMRNLIDDSQNRGLMIRIAYVLKMQDVLIHLDERFENIKVRCVRNVFKKAAECLIRLIMVDMNSRMTNLDLRNSNVNLLESSRHKKKILDDEVGKSDIGFNSEELSFEHIEAQIGRLESRINEIDVDTKASFTGQKNQLDEVTGRVSAVIDRLMSEKFARLDEEIAKIAQIRKEFTQD